MAYELDPEIATVLAAILEQSADLPVVERGDWKTLRARGNIGQAYLASLVPSSPDVQLTSFSTMTQDSTPIELRWYTRKNADPGSAVVYIHGGGMILGNLDLYDAVVSEYVAGRPGFHSSRSTTDWHQKSTTPPLPRTPLQA
jgi:acetyl esterase/lipase